MLFRLQPGSQSGWVGPGFFYCRNGSAIIFMASFIPNDVLEDIRNQCDIVEIISQYIPLKRAGGNFKALCPFHNEKTPSFMVSSAKQIFHCFGCGAGGDVFGFVKLYERVDFVDAVKLLAERAGITLPEQEYTRTDNTQDLWAVNKFACQMFHSWLIQEKKARDYLVQRGFKPDIIRQFQLGYAPGGKELLKTAAQKGWKAELLLTAGLAVKTGSGLADMFRNRIMFPIYTSAGKVAGFSGRVLDDNLPKYINTSETAVFHKGKILYGLHVSKTDIIKQEKVIICEGYFDFLRVYQEGFHQVVASQGTAFTRDQVHLLRRYASTIIVAFDGDAAGCQASISGLEMFLEEGVPVKVVQLPEGYDPDSFVREKGIDQFRDLISRSRDIMDTKIASLIRQYSTNTTDGKLRIITEILPDILHIRNEIYKQQVIKKTAGLINIPEESIWIELGKLKKRIRAGRRPAKEQGDVMGQVIRNTAESAGERQLAQMLLNGGSLPAELADGSLLDLMNHEGHKLIIKLTIRLKKEGRWQGPGSLMSYIEDEKIRNLASRLAAEEVMPGLDKERMIRDCIYDIKRRYKEKRIKTLIAGIREAEKDKQDVIELIEEVNHLRKELIRLTTGETGKENVSSK